MRVDESMMHRAQGCRPQEAAARAVLSMKELDCGALAVVDECERPIGIVTRGDLLEAAASVGRPLDELGVDEAMTEPTYVCRIDDDVKEVEAIMQRYQLRQALVVDAYGKFAGMILRDVRMLH